MEWSKLIYSRKQITKAGKELAGIEPASMKYENAMSILNNWRSYHKFPLNTIQMALRRVSNTYCSSPLVSQRLKRSPSIINKLKLNPKMELARMQDIGGCRTVVDNLAEVNEIVDFLKNKSEMNHEIKDTVDYITTPKASGYRCYHMIYKYKSTDAKYEHYNNCLIEVQIRTKIQHSWATAVETMGTFLGEALKSSIGAEEWLQFFKLSGSAFALLEDTPLHPEFTDINALICELESLTNSLNVYNRMEYFKNAIKVISSEKLAGKYFMLTLDMNKEELSIQSYSKKHFDKAADDYLQLELKEIQDQKIDVVLVSVDSLNSLQQAYPNYFVDTTQFTENLKKILKLKGCV